MTERTHRGLPIVVVILLAVVLSGVPLNGQELFEQDPGFPECLGPEDPFCPSGFPGDGDGGGGGGSYLCQYCDAEMVNGQMEFHCKDVDYGEEGWTECTDDGQGTQCGVGGVGCGKV